MTQEEFIEILYKKGYSYEIEGDKIIVTHEGNVRLDSLPSLPSLPSGVVFRNEGDVNLYSLTSLHPGVEFNNKGSVGLDSLTSLPSGVEFRNGGDVWLDSLTSLPPGVEFRNKWNVYLRSLIGGGFVDWKGNIEGIDSNMLLNLMIKDGVFI